MKKADRKASLAGWTIAAVIVSMVVLFLPADDGEVRRRLEEATVSFVRPGMPSRERDFNLRGGKIHMVRTEGNVGLQAEDWFCCDLAVDDSPSLELIITYGRKDSADGAFAVLVDGKIIAEEKIPRYGYRERNGLTSVLYRLPEKLVAGKKKVTVRFEALEGGETGAVFGIRVVQAPEHLE